MYFKIGERYIVRKICYERIMSWGDEHPLLSSLEYVMSFYFRPLIINKGPLIFFKWISSFHLLVYKIILLIKDNINTCSLCYGHLIFIYFFPSSSKLTTIILNFLVHMNFPAPIF